MIEYSVIVPAYNAVSTLDGCLNALLNQSISKERYEVIVVDDGSTDRTADQVKNYPVRYLYQKNRGPATARNAGVKEAIGHIVLFTDSDCVPDARWIREMVRPFDDKEVAAVKGAYRTRQKSLTARFSQMEFEERFAMLKKAGIIDMVDTYSAGFRKEIFLKMGGFDISFPAANNEDTEFSYRMSKLGYRMVFNPDAIVYHLNHPDTIRRYARLKFWRGYWRMVVYKRFPDKMLKDTYTPQTLKLQILFLFLVFACLPFTVLFRPLGLYALFFSAILLSVFLLPFTLFAFKKDPFIGAAAPFFLLVRAASLGLGMLRGMGGGTRKI